jgi:ATP-dependent phosphofructokinase / diphosphate-dependent phosphofructokinase
VARFGILVGGGPAPGINGVIGAATVVARRSGAEVVGLLEGFRWLMQGKTDRTRALDEAAVAGIHLSGGSILQTSRANPTKKPEHLAAVVGALGTLGVDHLITIGGDDTAFSARRVSEEASGRVRVVHVPKTIDNDLPLPDGIPTFGFETAREHATRIVARLLEDARTAGRFYLVVMMGRTAGHLAVGAAKAAGATLALVPEDFPEERIRLAKILRILEGAVVKRASRGEPHGVVVLAEGLAAKLDPSDLEGLEDAPRDEHGHVRLAEVPFGSVVKDAVTKSLAELGLDLTFVEKDVGYELRCAEPSAFDLDYTRDLGAGAVRTLLTGGSGAMITRQSGAIVPIPFEKLMDPKTGKTRVRLVDPTTDAHRSARSLQFRLEREDLDDPTRLAALAKATNLTPDAFRKRFGDAV